VDRVQLRALKLTLKKECGWRVEIGVSPHDGHEFLRLYEHSPLSKKEHDTFIGIMPICTTLSALVSSAGLCNFYYQKGMGAEKTTLPA